MDWTGAYFGKKSGDHLLAVLGHRPPLPSLPLHLPPVGSPRQLGATTYISSRLHDYPMRRSRDLGGLVLLLFLCSSLVAVAGWRCSGCNADPSCSETCPKCDPLCVHGTCVHDQCACESVKMRRWPSSPRLPVTPSDPPSPRLPVSSPPKPPLLYCYLNPLLSSRSMVATSPCPRRVHH